MTWAALKVFLGSKLGIALLGGALALIGTGTMWTVKTLELRTAQTEAADARTAKAKCELDLSDVRANRDKLVGDIERQNQAVSELQARATAAESTAAVTALRIIAEGERADREIQAAPAKTADDLNRWLRGLFAPPR